MPRGRPGVGGGSYTCHARSALADVFFQATGIHLVRTCHTKHLSHLAWILSQEGKDGESLPWGLQRIVGFSVESKGIPSGEVYRSRCRLN